MLITEYDAEGRVTLTWQPGVRRTEEAWSGTSDVGTYTVHLDVGDDGSINHFVYRTWDAQCRQSWVDEFGDGHFETSAVIETDQNGNVVSDEYQTSGFYSSELFFWEGGRGPGRGVVDLGRRQQR